MIPLGVLAQRQAAAGGGGPLSRAWLGALVDAVNRSTYTITAANLGTASSDRHIVVAAAIRVSSQPPPTITAASIGGVTASIDYRAAGTFSSPMLITFIRAHVPTGTTGDIVVTYSASVARFIAGAWAITGGTPTVIDSDMQENGPTNLTLTDAPSGVLLAAASMAADADLAWTGVTEDAQTVVESQPGVFASTDTDGTGTTITNNMAAFAANMAAVVAYGPA